MSEQSQTECDFTIVIPTVDAAAPLARLLRSIDIQESVSLEIIVVDQESTDDTPAIAAQHGARLITLPRTRFYSPPATSRNEGARHGTGRYLLHLDADMELPDGSFLQRLLLEFSESTQAAVLHEEDQATGFWSRVKRAERLCYTGTAVESPRAMSRSLFYEVGEYDPKISSGEDYDLSQRIEQCTFVTRSHALWIYHHTGSLKLRSLLRKKFSYGRTASAYFDRSRSRGRNTAIGLLWLDLRCYVHGWRQLLHDPASYLGIFVLRSLEFSAIVSGMVFDNATRQLRAKHSGVDREAGSTSTSAVHRRSQESEGT